MSEKFNTVNKKRDSKKSRFLLRVFAVLFLLEYD